MKRFIDVLRGAWKATVTTVETVVKTAIGMVFTTTAIKIVDELSALAERADIPAEQYEPKLEGLLMMLPIPVPTKQEIINVMREGLQVLRNLTNKTVMDAVKEGIATEIANILSGKQHDIKLIKADIRTIFETVVPEQAHTAAAVGGAIASPAPVMS